MEVQYAVAINKQVLKKVRKLPLNIRQKLETLANVLRDYGPTGPHGWRKYSKLGRDKYHCHLTYHYVACWQYVKGTITIEVYYVGSREDAPY